MKRRTFLRMLGSMLAGTAIAPIANKVNAALPPEPIAKPETDPVVIAFYRRQTEIAQVKNATRQYRNWYQRAFGRLPVCQARYAADSRIYCLAWRFPELKLGAETDTPYLEFSSVESAQNFAARNSLTALGNRVFPNRPIG